MPSAAYRFGVLLEEDDRLRVIRGTDARDGHAVVLKQLRRAADAGGLERELVMLQSLELPGVVRALGIVDALGAPSLVLDDSGGESLERHLATQTIPLETKLDLAVRITTIVDTMHRAGVVNRNLRPSTIFWNAGDGRLELVDFSLATRATRDVASLSLPQAYAGPALYVSPEQTGRLDLVVDRRSDLYALGATFYHLFTGRPPFERGDVAALVHAHIARVPERADKVASNVPSIVASILEKLLRKDPDDRYQTASGLEHDLRRARSGEQSFELGADDAPTILRVRDALVGRDAELGQLAALTRELAGGQRVMACVYGEAGSGKSALLLEFARSVVIKGGVYARGKFDLAIVTSPYHAIAQILEALAGPLLALPSAGLEALRDRLDAAVGALGPALVEAFPAVQPLFRSVAALESISPAGSRDRLVASFLAFVGAVVPSHVMTVLAVDDLQWADDASLTLLEALVQDSALTSLGLIFAARDQEIAPGSRVERLLAALETSGANVARIAVTPLPREAVATILADSLRCTLGRVEPLSHLVWEKTHGNPFFVRALLETAVDRGFVRYESRFVWDDAAIAASPVTENVATLLADRLRDLPQATTEALTIAARIGEPIECKLVASMLGVDERALLSILGPAFERGMVLRAGTAVRFAHDRVVEAAIALASPERSKAIHAKLSAVLLEQSDDRRFFEAVDHLSLAAEPENEAEQARRSSLALAAARRAHGARAFGAAERYFERYAATMSARSFEEQFDATFDAHLAWAEAAFLAGSYERAEKLLEQLDRRASNPNQLLRVRRILITFYETTSRYVQAIQVSFATLAAVGVVLPDYEAISPADIQTEIGRFLERFARIDPACIPVCPSRTTCEAISMLVDVAVPLWSARVDALPLVVARAAFLSLEEGLAPASSVSLVVLGSMLCVALGDATVGTAVAKLGLQVQERVGSRDYEAFARYAYAAMVQFHSESARLGRDGLLASYHRSLALGSLRQAAAAMESYAQRGALIGLPLAQVAEDVIEGRAAMLRLQQESTLTFFETLRHFVERIQEREETEWDLGPRRTDASSALLHFREMNHGGLIAVHTTFRLLELLAAGQAEAAYTIARADQEALLQPRGQLQTELGIALFALVSARCAPIGDEAADAEIARAAERFERSARFEATSFAGYHALVEAARLDRAGAFSAAWAACDRAIDVFERDSVLHLLAIANELAARIHQRAGNGQRVVRFYQQAAHRAYERWGAPKAVRRLAVELGLVTGSPALSDGAGRDSSQVDVVSLLKATRAIASEIELDRLITTLLRIVAENAGANRAYLFLERDGALELEARCDAELSVARALPEERTRVSDAPFAIATIAFRTREARLYKDASLIPQFASDPYLTRRASTAVLASPIERLGKVAGVIVLENDLVAAAFTAHHLQIVAALNAQIAIALENATLYSEVRVHAASLAQSEDRFRRLTENSLAGIYIAQDGLFVYVNPAFERILGAAPGSVVGTPFRDIVHPDDLALMAERVRDRLERGTQTVHYELRALRRDGTTIWLEILGSTMLHQGRPALFGNLLDVTARKEAQRKQVELAAIVESSSDAIIGKTQEGIITSWNRGAEEIFGYAAGEAIGQSMLFVIPPERRYEETDILARIARGETIAHYETVRVRKDGQQIVVSATISPLKDPDGQVIGASKIARDITEHRKLQDGLRASAEEMRQLYRRLATVEDDERRALHAELHDQVGANLSALRLELEVAISLLARTETASAQRHLASACETAAETIAMARDLMAELRPPALDDYGLVAALRTFAETQSVRLALRLDVTGHELSPRPSRLVEDALFRIAHEAVINAARHASASRVVLELVDLDKRVQLAIADDGVGFDPEAPVAGPDHWGLKNMHERARAVGGMLRVTTAPGAGTRIVADVPRAGS